MGGGGGWGDRLYFLWIPGDGGAHCIYILLELGEGVIQNLDDGLEFQPAHACYLNNEWSLSD